MSGELRICRYFARGVCTYGENCKYLHATEAAPALAVTSPPTAPKDGLSRPPVVDLGDQMSFHFQALALKEPAQRRVPTCSTKIDSSWVDVPEFVPRFALATTYTAPIESSSMLEEAGGPSAGCLKSWAEVVNPTAMAEISVTDAESQLCPFGEMGECRYGEQCAYIHGDICDMCSKATLHPFHEAQRRSHQRMCVRAHEEQMELSFAVARSREKTCGICMDVVMDKPKGEARFGILPNCNHCYCLNCLRKWRQAKFENKIIRSCPECRQTSDYICPSRFWVDSSEEKQKLLTEYKDALNSKECKYYRRGSGECPFGNKCFYKHVSADGKVVDVGPPQRRPRRANADGELTLVERLLFYDFLEERDGRFVIPLDIPLEYLDILELLSDSDSEFDVIL